MTVMAYFSLAVCCMAGGWLLVRARWPYRAPGSAIVLWQSLGLTWGLALIGGLLAWAVTPYHRGVIGGVAAVAGQVAAGRWDGLPGAGRLLALLLGAALAAILVGALVASFHDVVIARRRHRAVLMLVGHTRPEVPGAVVLDHPAAAAYCLPGAGRGGDACVVVSEGTLRLLGRAELAAVLSHEWAHARQRHDLVLLPFGALRRALPSLGLVAQALAAVELLVEMCADDRARREHTDRLLAGALMRFSTASPGRAPAGALAAADTAVVARMHRLLASAPELPRWRRGLVLAVAGVLVVLPAVLAWLP